MSASSGHKRPRRQDGRENKTRLEKRPRHEHAVRSPTLGHQLIYKVPGDKLAQGWLREPSLQLEASSNTSIAVDIPGCGDLAHYAVQSEGSPVRLDKVDAPLDKAIRNEDHDIHTADAPYDTCFGLVEIEATVDSTSRAWLPVNLEPTPYVLHILAQESGERIGWGSTVSSPAIYRLVERARVFLSGTLLVRSGHQQERRAPAVLRVVINGFMEEHETVAKMLSDTNLYLQNPTRGECGDGLTYFNPHYLLRPGGSMPELRDNMVSGRDRSAGRAANAYLSEVEHARMSEIFDSAYDPDAKPDICPSSRLQSVLKEHQISALAVMTEQERGHLDSAGFPSLWELRQNSDGKKEYHHVVTNERQTRPPSPVRGGILADEMGLGKTLSAIALILWHLDRLDSVKADAQLRRPTLIVTPKSKWVEQFKRHVKPGCIKAELYYGNLRPEIARDWHCLDVVITTYQIVLLEIASGGPLSRMRWARIILDEAHTIRNRWSKTASAVQDLQAPCRWCLTGTPIQNCLDDYGSLLSFIGVPFFERPDRFKSWIVEPIKERKEYALKRLRELVRATCLRRTKITAGKGLDFPEKKEVNLVLDLDSDTREMYNFFRQRAATAVLEVERLSAEKKSKTRKGPGWGGKDWADILPLIVQLRRICDHGEKLLRDDVLRAWKDRDAKWLDWQLITASMEEKKCESCGSSLGENRVVVATLAELACGHNICPNCLAGDEDSDRPESSPSGSCPKCRDRSPLPTPSQEIPAREEYKPSVKIDSLLKNLRAEVESESDAKSVVFSCWTAMLDFIQKALGKTEIGFRRIDGRTSMAGRAKIMDAFRSDANCKVLICSIGSMGQGVNLTVANHVHIIEPQWNPMVEAQAVDRVHRIGQRRNVVITRYFIKNSIENYIRSVQEEKVRLIHQSFSAVAVQESDVNKMLREKLIEALQ